MDRSYRVAVFNDTRRTSHYGCEIVMENLIEQLRRRRIEPVFFWPMGRDWRGQRGIDAMLRSVDAVIVNGEGSIHHSARRARAHYLAEIAGFARHTAGIPSFLVNASVHEVEDEVIDKLRAFDAVFVREGRSLALLEGFGVAAARVPDLTLLTAVEPASGRAGVLGTDSVKADVTHRIRRLCRRRAWHYSKMTHAARPRLTEHELGYEYLRRHAKWLHAVLLGRNTRDRERFVRHLAGHALVCTGRFHAVTLALATSTPFLAIESNTPKISGLLEDVFGHTARLTGADLMEAMTDPGAHSWSASERHALAIFLQSAHASIHGMFDRIRSHLDERA